MHVRVMSIHTARVELQRSFGVTFNLIPLPVRPEDDETKDGVSFRQSLFNVDGLLRRRLRLWGVPPLPAIRRPERARGMRLRARRMRTTDQSQSLAGNRKGRSGFLRVHS